MYVGYSVPDAFRTFVRACVLLLLCSRNPSFVAFQIQNTGHYAHTAVHARRTCFSSSTWFLLCVHILTSCDIYFCVIMLGMNGCKCKCNVCTPNTGAQDDPEKVTGVRPTDQVPRGGGEGHQPPGTPQLRLPNAPLHGPREQRVPGVRVQPRQAVRSHGASACTYIL